MAERQRIAFVTGAASGLGLSACERLAADGHAIVLVDRSDKVLGIAERLREEGHLSEGHVANVTGEAALTALRDAIPARRGRARSPGAHDRGAAGSHRGSV